MVKQLECAHCGNTFSVRAYRIAEGAKYCSHRCSVADKTKAPSQITCPQCNTSFKPKHAKQIHCSRSCSHKSMSQEVERTCERCGVTFAAKRNEVKKGKARFCGKTCFHAHHKEYMTENPSRPRKQIELTCQWCGKKFERYESYIKRSNMRSGRYCSRDCKHSWQRSIVGKNHPLDKKIECTCEWCGKTYRSQRVHKDKTRFCSRRCQGSYSAANMDRAETTIEASIRNLLSAMNVTYEQEKKMGPWVCDFVIESSKLVIECDGIYWHSSPKVKKRDSQKDKWLNTHGYMVLRLPESDIKNRLDYCQQQVMSHLPKVQAAQLLQGSTGTLATPEVA